MARRWPLLSASVVLLVATLSAPPARALDEPERLRLVGERAFADGLYPLSRRVLERFVAEYPNDPHAGSALFLLGRARFALGDTESALEAFRRAQAAISPAEALEAKFWEAETLFRLRRFTEARAAYDAVVKTDAAAPRAPEALYGLAWSDLELGRPETAIAELRELLARWPDHALVPSATLHLARTLAEQKRFGDALPLLEGFATKYPNHKQLPDAQYLLGWARVKSGDTKAGLADLRAFVAAAPNHELAPTARRMITETITRHGDPSELGAAYKTLMDETPPTPEGLYDAGSIAGRLARPSDQVAAWRRLRKEFPDHPLATRAALDLANAAFKRKDWKDAAAQAQAAAQSGDGGGRGLGGVLWGALLAARPGGPAIPLALVRRPPELPALTPFAEAPLDKPRVGVRELPPPRGPPTCHRSHPRRSWRRGRRSPPLRSPSPRRSPASARSSGSPRRRSSAVRRASPRPSTTMRRRPSSRRRAAVRRKTSCSRPATGSARRTGSSGGPSRQTGCSVRSCRPRRRRAPSASGPRTRAAGRRSGRATPSARATPSPSCSRAPCPRRWSRGRDTVWGSRATRSAGTTRQWPRGRRSGPGARRGRWRATSASGSAKRSGAWAGTTAPPWSSTGSSTAGPTRCWTPAGSGSAGGASPRSGRRRAQPRFARISRRRPRPRRRPGPARSATGPRRGARPRRAGKNWGRAAAPPAGLAPPALPRATALMLQAEAAYHAATYAAASAAFRRALVEFSGHPLAGAARLGVAWAALRQDKDDEARREFLEFVRRDPRDPQAADALLLAAELALKAPTEWTQAKALLDRIVAEYPNRPRTEFAKLNRAVLLLRTGDLKAAQAELSDWIARAPFGPLLGRAYAALGAALLAGGVPADAAKAFAQAQREGLGALATLGLAASELARGKPDVAKGLFEDARDKGTPAIAHAAEYGLAATAFLGGAHKEFRQPALAELDAAPKGRGAPRLLYVLTGLAVEEKDWAGALGFAKRLASEFPVDEGADDAFESIGAAAAQARAWPVVAEAYSELRSRYPKSPFADAAIVTLAEAQVETGRVDVARRELEKFVTSAPADAKLGRAWLLLARARAATRDRTGAIDAYARAAKDGRVREWSKTEILSYARLLAEDKRAGEARAVLSEFLRRADGADAADAAYALGETYQGEGDYPAAVEYFMTAAYVAPESAPGRRALLGAAASLVALKQPDSAAIVYKKLLEQREVPSELADAARRGLKEIAR